MTPNTLTDPRTLEHILRRTVAAEQAVLGAMLLDPVALDLVLLDLGPADFSTQHHAQIFAAAQDLSAQGRPVDLVTVTELLGERKQLEGVGGPVAVAELTERVASASNIQAYTKIVAQSSKLRRVASVCTDTLDFIAQHREELDPDEIADRACGQMMDATADRAAGAPEPVEEVMQRTLYQIDEYSKQKGGGLSTGWTGVDNLTLGMRPGQLHVYAARPGVGKTAAMLNIATDLTLRQNVPTAFFSLEMDSEELALRMVCGLAQVSMELVQLGRVDNAQRGRLVNAANRMHNAKLFLTGSGHTTVQSLRTSVRQMRQRHGVKVVMVDYLQILPTGLARPHENRTQEVTYISGALKALAKQTKTTIIAACQLNRDSTKTTTGNADDKRPRLSELRESGSIEQDADKVVLIWRRFEADEHGNTEAEFDLAKNRQGRTGTLSMVWQGPFTRFAERA
jgi:replicative DNA helicase